MRGEIEKIRICHRVHPGTVEDTMELATMEAQMYDADRVRRLEALAQLARQETAAGLPGNVNNHIHTTYSFSPYTPAAALYRARAAGLITAGIMDHDSIAGAEEFRQAGEILGMGVTAGLECRISMAGTPFAHRRINNPDQDGIIYMALHSVPRSQFGRVQAFFEPYRAARHVRNRAMTERIACLMAPHGVTLDYDADVLPLSQAAQGGGVTERHILFALAHKIMAAYGQGQPLVDFLEKQLGLPVSGQTLAQLQDAACPIYAYDLLNVLKGHFVAQFYIPATDECPPPQAVLDLARQVHAIAAYAYLGDVGQSVTGDKRAQKFEDDYLPELLGYLKGLGFQAVTYMPTRNTDEQLTRLRALCEGLEFFQICGEDINQPRQDFVCHKLNDPAFSNLVEATWAMIAHERLCDKDPELGLFSQRTAAEYPNLADRVAAFARLGQQMFA